MLFSCRGGAGRGGGELKAGGAGRWRGEHFKKILGGAVAS